MIKKISENIIKIIFCIFTLVILILFNATIIINDKSWPFIILSLVLIVLLLFIFLYWVKYYKEIFIFSLILGHIFIYRVNVSIAALLSLLLILFYITFQDNTKYFNELKLPKFLKKNLILLVIAVAISGIFSRYYSVFSLINTFFYLTYVLSGYIFFKSIKNYLDIERLLYVFILMTFVGGITKFVGILIYGMIRGIGIAEFFYMEYAPIALLMIFFLYFVNDKPKLLMILSFIVILISMILDQSRFAWLGFTLSMIYGCFVCYRYSFNFRKFLKDKLFAIVIFFLIIVSLIYIFNLDKIIVGRVSNISFNFFDQKEESTSGSFIENSLESRIMIWVTAFNAFKHNILTGVGYNQFAFVSEDYNILPQILFILYVKNLDAHTTFLNYLSETGIIGFLSFFAYMVTAFVLSFKSIKLSKDDWLKISLTLNILMFYLFVDCIYSGNFTFGPSAYLIHLIIFMVIANYVLLKTNVIKNIHK